MKPLALVFFFLMLFACAKAQQEVQDSLKLIRKDSLKALRLERHKPATASILSAVLPGAGQIYNRKYWKAPIVWGGLGACGYFFAANHIEYLGFRDAYRDRVNGIPNPEFDIYDATALRSERDLFQRNRDFAAIIGLVVYLLNIVDATVDGHLYHFDVSDDLSLYWSPVSRPAGLHGMQQTGIQLGIRF